MGLLTILFFILFLFAIPVFLFATVSKQYGSGLKIPKAIFKLLSSFLAHVLLSIFTFLFFVLVYIGADPKPEYRPSFEDKLIVLIVVLVYGVFGWLLCSLVNGKVVRPWLIFRFNAEQAQSIFDSK